MEDGDRKLNNLGPQTESFGYSFKAPQAQYALQKKEARRIVFVDTRCKRNYSYLLG